MLRFQAIPVKSAKTCRGLLFSATICILELVKRFLRNKMHTKRDKNENGIHSADVKNACRLSGC